jgi:hypothetical protein
MPIHVHSKISDIPWSTYWVRGGTVVILVVLELEKPEVPPRIVETSEGNIDCY